MIKTEKLLLLIPANTGETYREEAGLFARKIRSVSKWMKLEKNKAENTSEAIKRLNIYRRDVQETPKRNTRWQDDFIFQKKATIF